MRDLSGVPPKCVRARGVTNPPGAGSSGSQTATPVERRPGAPQDTVEGSGKAGLPDRENPYGAPQVAVGGSGVAPPGAAATSHSLTQASTS